MNKQKTKRTWAVILAALLTLALLLTACGTGGDTPTGDSSTPGVTETPSNTPDATDPTPDDTTEPDNTPSETELTPGTTETPKYIMPSYDEEYKTFMDEKMVLLGQDADIDIENVLDEIYEKYGKYLNVNISKDTVKAAFMNREISSYIHGKSPILNISGISPDAVAKVNEFLVSMGEEPLGITDADLLKTHNELMADVGMKPFPAILTPEENITAFWLAASLYYDPTYDGGSIRPCLDITFALAQAMADPSKDETVKISDYIWSDFAKLYGTFDDYGAAIVLTNP